ncbi:peptidyl-prolyl cis-trans isomerase [Fodinicurvata sediminis]|uniref:peptidyl-prolyl cis-trans isomerase n=1 Tax=Fodinicurvata sediminis TaxID=1121832 RepID=UPI0003B47F75|nr:peptidyl-prolyl cis-trans isomerase [Fodinicurvata sediminis]
MGKLRGIIAKISLFVLLGLLILSFALWGVGDIFRGQQASDNVAVVGEREISSNAYRQAFMQAYNRQRQILGEDFTIDMARQIGLDRQVLEQLIADELLIQHAAKLGLVTTDKQIQEVIVSTPSFQNSEGEFDRLQFQQLLRSNQMSEAQLVASLRQDIPVNQISSALAAPLSVPQALKEQIKQYRDERRIADYIVIPRASMSDVEAPDEETLRSFYEERRDEFMAPEYRRISYIHLSPDVVRDTIGVDETRLRDEFEARKDEFSVPEERSVEQGLFDNQEAAREAYEALEAGGDFSTVIEETSGDSPIELGFVRSDDLPDSLANDVFDLEEGEVTPPLESSFGWHIIRVNEIREGNEPEFEEVRDQLREEVIEYEAVEATVTLANDLDDLLAGGAPLEEAAQEMNLDVQVIEAVDSEGRNREGETIENLPDRENFLSEAFSLSEGQESLLIETSSGDSYFVLQVDAVEDPAPRPFEEVANEIEGLWIREQREDQAYALAEELESQAAAGESLEDLAVENDLEVQETTALLRSDDGPSRDLVSQLFSLAEGEITLSQGSRGPIVARLKEIVPAAAENANEEDGVELETELQQGLGNDLETLFRRGLENEYEVTINEDRLQRAIPSY